MKRARAGSPGTWDRKLLEVEEKDPNRWRHTGYKQLYLDGSVSPPSRGRRSPPPNRRTPPLVSTTTRERPRTPPPLVSSTSRDRVTSSRNGVSPPHHQVSSTAAARRDRDRESRPKARRPPSPPPQRKRSRSASSLSTCTDDSCSMCSLKVKRPRPRSRSRSFSVPRSSPVRVPPPAPPVVRPPAARPRVPPPTSHCKPLNSGTPNAQPSSLSRRRPNAPPAMPAVGPAPPPTRELLLARDATRKRTRDEKVLEWQQSQLIHQQQRMKAAAASASQKASSSTIIKTKEKPVTKLKTHIKKEGEKKRKRTNRSSSGSQSPRRPVTPVSPGAIAAALASGRGGGDDSSGNASSSDSDDSQESGIRHPPIATGKLTLSERFGKMAQWSADRSANIENMRITRRDGESNFTVSIEASDSPPPRYAHEPAPVGHFPEELSAVAPGGLLSWDDVHVRYEYYKSRGYLRGLTLSDYVKWEEWWYKYQEWLKRERAYERWATAGSGSRERRRRGGRRNGGGRRHRAGS